MYYQKIPQVLENIEYWHLIMTIFNIAEIWPFLSEPNGFLNMYCIIFHYMYEQWKIKKYTYLQFPVLLQEVSAHVQSLLRHNPTSLHSTDDLMKQLCENPQLRFEIVRPIIDEMLTTGDGVRKMPLFPLVLVTD